MRRDQLNDEYLNLIEKQRLYFKTVKDFQEVIVLFKIIITCFRCFTVGCCHLVNDSVIACLGLWLLHRTPPGAYVYSYINSRMHELHYILTELLGVAIYLSSSSIITLLLVIVIVYGVSAFLLDKCDSSSVSQVSQIA